MLLSNGVLYISKPKHLLHGLQILSILVLRPVPAVVTYEITFGRDLEVEVLQRWKESWLAQWLDEMGGVNLAQSLYSELPERRKHAT